MIVGLVANKRYRTAAFHLLKLPTTTSQKFQFTPLKKPSIHEAFSRELRQKKVFSVQYSHSQETEICKITQKLDN